MKTVRDLPPPESANKFNLLENVVKLFWTTLLTYTKMES